MNYDTLRIILAAALAPVFWGFVVALFARLRDESAARRAGTRDAPGE